MDRVPTPAATPLTEPYWAACRRGELALQRCVDCTRFVHFPEPACPYCGGTDLPYARVAGHGTIHTYSVIERTFLPGFEPPYTVAWIDLPEGARVFGQVLSEEVRIGLPVEVVFEDLPGFGPIPQWRRAAVTERSEGTDEQVRYSGQARPEPLGEGRA